MKILFYIDTMVHKGGAQRVMSILANELKKKGHDIIMVNDFPAPVHEYEIDENIDRFFLEKQNRKGFIIKNIARITQLRRYIKREAPDVAISFLGRTNIRLIYACVGLNVKTILSVRNDPVHEFGARGIKKRIINLIYGRSDGIVFQTKAEESYFSEKIKDKSTVILNPIDEKFFDVKRPRVLHHIVTTGRLEEQKNHKLLIRAFYDVKKKFSEEKLFIYGEGILRDELESYIKELKLEGSVFLPGNVENVPEVLSEAEIFVLSSDYEGLPNALMEAMAAGVPCISTDCAGEGAAELIENGENGLLTDVGNAEDLANAIRKLISDYEYAERLGKNAKAKAFRYRIDNIIDQWEGYFLILQKSNSKK